MRAQSHAEPAPSRVHTRETAEPSWDRPTVAVAESVTGGLVMGRIVRTPDTGGWFKGGVVAYHSGSKQDLLQVPPGRVVTARTAHQMARGVRKLLGADVGIATTGVAGPESVEGQPVGTVFIGWSSADNSDVLCVKLDGDPDEIREQTVDLACRQLEQVRALLREQT